MNISKVFTKICSLLSRVHLGRVKKECEGTSIKYFPSTCVGNTGDISTQCSTFVESVILGDVNIGGAEQNGKDNHD